MKPNRLPALASATFALLLLGLAAPARAQSPQPLFADCPAPPASNPSPEELSQAKKVAKASPETVGVKLKVLRLKDGKPVPAVRERFYLLEKSVRESGLDWAGAPRHDTYMSKVSEPLRKWLKDHDCDTIYCPELESEFAKAKDTIPELKEAYEAGLRKYKDPQLALKWLTVNLPRATREARTGYYYEKKKWVDAAVLKIAGEKKPKTLMTDEQGEVAFNRLTPGKTYYLSNLFPTEDKNIVWDCKVTAALPNLKKLALYSTFIELNPQKVAAPAAGGK